MCEVKSFLYNQSVWDSRKLIFTPHFVFEMKDLHPLVIKDGDAMMIFFQVKADDDLKSLKSWNF